jgi:hypothetical protein
MDPGIAKARARGMRYHKVEAVIQHVHYVALDMRTRPVRRKKVARYRIVAFSYKSVANYSAKFTSNQYFHFFAPSFMELKGRTDPVARPVANK